MRTSLGSWVFVTYVPTQPSPSSSVHPTWVCSQGHLNFLLALSCLLSSHFRFASSYSFAFSRPLEHDLPGFQGSCALGEKTFYTVLQHVFIPLQSAPHLNSLIVLTFGPQYFSLPLFFLVFPIVTTCLSVISS